MSELEKFLEERSKIPIPSGDIAWVKLLAKELALGVHRSLWDPLLILRKFMGGAGTVQENPSVYFETRWKDYDLTHLANVLVGHDYMVIGESQSALCLTAKAYDLIDDVEPYDIFVSYKRSESSPFALLLLARLKEHSLVPFLDMALEAGGNWHADLEERIKGCDYFIVLLGEDTLSSPMTVKEINWALDAKRTIIPIWHSGFDIDSEKWAELPADVMSAIQQTNAIRVTDESASGYNTAIVELLNRFGITP